MLIDYAGSVHDEEEIAAVVEVLRGPATALRIGKNVKKTEQLVAEMFSKRQGIIRLHLRDCATPIGLWSRA